MAKDTYLKRILGEKSLDRVKHTKVLMVGAGGIGCELLKNLILSAYGEVHIVDLDTVTLSNLNRQFLFRKKDIDKSKSLTISQAVESFNYFGTKLVSYHGSIMDTKQFPIQWWEQFSIIYNALDNVEARQHVNKMCLLLKTPLMDSGTEGLKGNMYPIYPDYTECYDCQAKTLRKTYPVCTIRSTPSLPVHCITWAKEFLFKQLFDEEEIDIGAGQKGGLNDADAIAKESDNAEEIKNLTREANELADLRKTVTSAETNEFVSHLIRKIFITDIERLALIDELWKSRKRPVPLDYTEYESSLQRMLHNQSNKEVEDENDVENYDKNNDKNVKHDSILSADTKNWSILENLYVVYKSSQSIQKRICELKEPFVSFDKDDEDAMNFVAATSNLRSHIFHIGTMSKFDIKEIAGNIIPAIATTNALVSGFSAAIGTNFYKFNLGNEKGRFNYEEICKSAYTMATSLTPQLYVISSTVSGPLAGCPTEAGTARGVFKVRDSDMGNLTLNWLLEQLKVSYGYSRDSISIQAGKMKLIYDIDFDDYVEAKLKDVPGFQNQALILIQDDDDLLEKLELLINVVDPGPEGDYNGIVLTKLPSVVVNRIASFEDGAKELEDSDSDALEVIEDQNSGDSDIEIIEDTDVEPSLKKRRIA